MLHQYLMCDTCVSVPGPAQSQYYPHDPLNTQFTPDCPPPCTSALSRQKQFSRSKRNILICVEIEAFLYFRKRPLIFFVWTCEWEMNQNVVICELFLTFYTLTLLCSDGVRNVVISYLIYMIILSILLQMWDVSTIDIFLHGSDGCLSMLGPGPCPCQRYSRQDGGDQQAQRRLWVGF